jgi:DNA-binding HxlR family transcriptional regulator
MRRRDYGEYCGLARALELVGERWGLLIVRELLARQCRYTDLLEDLPGIPTNVLSARLKELEASGIVERLIAPAPQRGVVYALTADGQELEAVVLALARWGTSHLGDKQPGQVVPSSTLAMSLRAAFNADQARGLTAAWEIRTAGVALYAACADGRLATGVGAGPVPPDLVITVPADEVPPYQQLLRAIGGGQAGLAGPEELRDTFLRVFTPRPRTDQG